MWEQLGSPLLPFVIFGSHELFNKGNWVNEATGQCTVRFLKPIYPQEATSRDHMMRILRRRMLEALLDVPSTVGQSISAYQYAVCMLSNVVSIALVVLTIFVSYSYVVLELGHSVKAAILGWFGGVFLITFVLYVYYVYIVDYFRVDIPVTKMKAP